MVAVWKCDRCGGVAGRLKRANQRCTSCGGLSWSAVHQVTAESHSDLSAFFGFLVGMVAGVVGAMAGMFLVSTAVK